MNSKKSCCKLFGALLNALSNFVFMVILAFVAYEGLYTKCFASEFHDEECTSDENESEIFTLIVEASTVMVINSF
jgi:hypothetical protein